MDFIYAIHNYLIGNFGPGIYFPLGFLALIGIAGQWMLYYKCDLPGVSCIVPVWNVTTFLKIMGRPAWQALIVIGLPLAIIWGLYYAPDGAVGSTVGIVAAVAFVAYMLRVYYELCHCFGRTRKRDFLMCILFNGFYVLYLGLSDNTEYLGTYKEVKDHSDHDHKDHNQEVGQTQVA